MKSRFIGISIILLFIANVLVLHFCLLSFSQNYEMFFERFADRFKEPEVKIFVTYYKPYQLPKESKVIQPIQVGRAIEKEPFMGGQLSDKDISWLHQNMIGDDTGDNISAKNREFDVLTAYYWVWKHYEEIGNPKYIGFFAHRKFLAFEQDESHKFDLYQGYDSEEFKELLKKHKMAVRRWIPWDGPNDISFYNNYLIEHHIEDMNVMIKVIKRDYPQMVSSMNNVLFNVGKAYAVHNYWIMEKDLAFDYFEKLFNVMFEVEKEIGNEVQKRHFYQRRAFGFLAERFFAIWLEYQMQQKSVDPLLGVTQYW